MLLARVYRDILRGLTRAGHPGRVFYRYYRQRGIVAVPGTNLLFTRRPRVVAGRAPVRIDMCSGLTPEHFDKH